MSTTVVVLAFVVAVAAAARSTWSPCGQSMLSQLTPIGEASRGHRYRVTATWYLIGAVVGGVTLGGLIALAAWGVHALALTTTTLLVLAAATALIGGILDSRLLGVGPPFLLRQVNEYWLNKYRAYVYALGFGWQIGAGITTYIMTAAVFVTILLGALGASVWAGLAVGVWFGFARGMTVWITARATTPAALRSLHRRFDAFAEPVRRAVIVVQLAVAAVALGAGLGVAGMAVGVAIAVAVAVPVLRRSAAPSVALAPVRVGQPVRT
jgi:MFS family permease